MTRHCPECDRENGIGVRFCAGCGTDVPAFVQAAEALERMRGFAKASQWGRVLKESSILPQDLQLRGERGAAVLKEIGEKAAVAEDTEKKLAECRQRLERALAEHHLDEAEVLCRKVLALDPEDRATAERARQIDTARRRAALLSQSETMATAAAQRRFVATGGAARAILTQQDLLAAWTEPDPLLNQSEATGEALRTAARAARDAADKAIAEATAAVQSGEAALAAEDCRTASAKADEALRCCADLAATTELRRQVDETLAELKRRADEALAESKRLVAEVQAQVGECRALLEAGRLKDARAGVDAVVEKYGDVEIPDDAGVAS